MLVISSREFRENQKKYFDSIDNGEQVIVQRGKDRAYKLVPVTNDDTCMTQEEFYAKIEHALQQVKDGKTNTLDIAKLDDFLGL